MVVTTSPEKYFKDMTLTPEFASRYASLDEAKRSSKTLTSCGASLFVSSVILCAALFTGGTSPPKRHRGSCTSQWAILGSPDAVL